MLQVPICALFRRTSIGHFLLTRAGSHNSLAALMVKGQPVIPCSINKSCFLYSKSSGYSTSIKDVSLTKDGKTLQIEWSSGKKSNFHSMWLRFNCQCHHCLEHQSNMTRYKADEIPTELKLTNATRTDSGHIRVYWDAENHTAEFDPSYLKKNCYSTESLSERRKSVKPDFNTGTDIPQMLYSEVRDSNRGLYKWLRIINDKGLCLLKGVPVEDQFCTKIIESIGPIQNTLYGGVWDVRLEENPINVAYTNEALSFHMDLVQYESPPGIQILQCLQFDSSLKGGETTLIDMFAVAETFREKYPEHFKTLCTVPSTFQRIHMTRDNPVKMIMRKPHILLNHQDEIIGINWHTNLHGPLSVEEEFVDSFYKAYLLFAKEVYAGNFTSAIRLKPGDLIAYNNRRMAHGRNSFTQNGKRHLQGLYINIDDYKSKLMALAEFLGDDRPIKRVFKNDWL